MDAISLLMEDHQKLRDAFSQYDTSGNSEDEKKRLADEICSEATKHTRVEEEIFYPSVRDEIEDLADKIQESFAERACEGKRYDRRNPKPCGSGRRSSG